MLHYIYVANNKMKRHQVSRSQVSRIPISNNDDIFPRRAKRAKIARENLAMSLQTVGQLDLRSLDRTALYRLFYHSDYISVCSSLQDNVEAFWGHDYTTKSTIIIVFSYTFTQASRCLESVFLRTFFKSNINHYYKIHRTVTSLGFIPFIEFLPSYSRRLLKIFQN